MLKLELSHFFNKSVFLYQNPDYVKISMDTILLSATVNLIYFKNKKNISVLDVGSGIGGGDVLLAYRLKNISITGIELQKDLIDIATENIKKNNMSGRISFINSDIKQLKVIQNDGFDWVMTNPPFHMGSTSPLKNKSLSYTENNITLSDWIKLSTKHVKNNGYFSIIHKPTRLDDIIFNLKSLNFGSISIFPVFTKDNDLIAKRVIVISKKGAKTGLTLHKNITQNKLIKILQNPVDIYTDLN